jgi:hypothetical protein
LQAHSAMKSTTSPTARRRAADGTALADVRRLD